MNKIPNRKIGIIKKYLRFPIFLTDKKDKAKQKIINDKIAVKISEKVEMKTSKAECSCTPKVSNSIKLACSKIIEFKFTLLM